MLLACDIGNTFIKFAVYDNDTLVKFFRTTYTDFQIGIFNSYSINKIAITSVVPTIEADLTSYFIKHSGITPYQVKAGSPFTVKVNYSTPASLGVDRICSAEGAFSLFKNDPLFHDYSEKVFFITIDSGTATTLNIVKYNAEFIGGIIAPGIYTMINSLNKGTAQLPEIDLADDYNGLIGTDTKSCIASGVLNSTLGLIERTCNYLRDQMGAQIIKIYVTGGNGKVISDKLNYENVFIEDLVLLGVKSVYERI